MKRRKRDDEDATVPQWSGFGIGLQLESGQTFGELFDGPRPDAMPSLAVLRAAWETYRDRFDGNPRAWARLVFDEGMSPDEALAALNTPSRSKESQDEENQ